MLGFSQEITTNTSRRVADPNKPQHPQDWPTNLRNSSRRLLATSLLAKSARSTASHSCDESSGAEQPLSSDCNGARQTIESPGMMVPSSSRVSTRGSSNGSSQRTRNISSTSLSPYRGDSDASPKRGSASSRGAELRKGIQQICLSPSLTGGGKFTPVSPTKSPVRLVRSSSSGRRSTSRNRRPRRSPSGSVVSATPSKAASETAMWERNRTTPKCNLTNSETGTTIGSVNSESPVRRMKRGGSMRNILRHQRRAEKEELHRSDIFHYDSSKKMCNGADEDDDECDNGVCESNRSDILILKISPEQNSRRIIGGVKDEENYVSRPSPKEKSRRKRDDPSSSSLPGTEEPVVGDDSIASLDLDEAFAGVRKPRESSSTVMVSDCYSSKALSTMLDDPAEADSVKDEQRAIERVRDFIVTDATGSTAKYDGVIAKSSGLPHLNGKMKFSDGRTFEGIFVHGQKFEGKMTYPDGSSYTGQWSQGLRHGQGTYTFAKGAVYYHGAFVNDEMNGCGTLTWQSGSKFVGYFRNGLQHGPGKEYRPDGTLRREGVWKDGHLIEV